MTTQNQIGNPNQNYFKSYHIMVPFGANNIISGSDSGTAQMGSDTQEAVALGGAAGNQFQFYYYLYLKHGVTYRFSFSAYKVGGGGIVIPRIKSEDALTTYNTLTSIDLYTASNVGQVNINKQTFVFSPAGFNAGDWVPCILDIDATTKNASSSGYGVIVSDVNSGFNFSEKYS